MKLIERALKHDQPTIIAVRQHIPTNAERRLLAYKRLRPRPTYQVGDQVYVLGTDDRLYVATLIAPVGTHQEITTWQVTTQAPTVHRTAVFVESAFYREDEIDGTHHHATPGAR